MSAEIEEEAGCGKNRRIFEYQINFASGTEDTDQFYQIDVTSFSTSSWGGGDGLFRPHVTGNKQ